MPHFLKNLFHRDKTVIIHDKTPTVNVNIHPETNPNMMPHSTVIHHSNIQPPSTVVHHTSMESQSSVVHQTTTQPQSTVFHQTTIQPRPIVIHETTVQPQSTVIHQTSIEQQPTMFHHSNVQPPHTMGHQGGVTIDVRPTFDGEYTTQNTDHFYGDSFHGFHHGKPSSHYFRKAWPHEHSHNFIREEIVHHSDLLGQPMNQSPCEFFDGPPEDGVLGDPNMESGSMINGVDNNFDNFGVRGLQLPDEDRVSSRTLNRLFSFLCL